MTSLLSRTPMAAAATLATSTQPVDGPEYVLFRQMAGFRWTERIMSPHRTAKPIYGFGVVGNEVKSPAD